MQYPQNIYSPTKIFTAIIFIIICVGLNNKFNGPTLFTNQKDSFNCLFFDRNSFINSKITNDQISRKSSSFRFSFKDLFALFSNSIFFVGFKWFEIGFFIFPGEIIFIISDLIEGLFKVLLI